MYRTPHPRRLLLLRVNEEIAKLVRRRRGPRRFASLDIHFPVNAAYFVQFHVAMS